jgi:protein O-mannosyl-transferase
MYLPVTYTLVSGIAAISKLFPLTGSVTGLNPHVFHLVNLIFHVFISLFVFHIIRLLLLTSETRSLQQSDSAITVSGKQIPQIDLAALCGALLFAIHPTQVEPVIWVSGIKDLSYGIFAFPAIYAYLYQLTRKNTNKGDVPITQSYIRSGFSQPLYLLSLFLFLLSILAKPAAVMVPVIIWLLSIFILRFPFKKITAELIPWLILSFPVMIIIMRLQSGARINYIPPLWSRPFLVGDTITYYLYKLFFPIQQGIVYDHIPEVVLGNWWGYLTWLIPFGMLLLFWFKRRSLTWIATGFLVFVAGFFTVSGLVPFIFQNLSAIADRYLYLSMLGPAIILGWLVYKRPKKSILIPVLIILCLLSVRSRFQVEIWSDPLRFLKHSLSISNHLVLHRNMGKLLMIKGLPDETVAHFEKQVIEDFKVTPQNRMDSLVQIESHLKLGYARELKKDPVVARQHFEKAVEYLNIYLRLYPGDYRASLRMGNALANLDILTGETNHTPRALEYYQQALREKPDLAEAHYFLASNYLKQGKLETAINHFKQELIIDPQNPRAHYEYGLALMQLNQKDEAIIHFQSAASLFPKNQQYQKTLAFVRDHSSGPNVTRPKDGSPAGYLEQGREFSRNKNYTQAIKRFQKVLELDPAYPEANYLLAVSYRNTGLLELAVKHYKKELALNPRSAEVHNDLGIVLFQLNQPVDGMKHIETAVQLNPGHSVYQSNLKKALDTLQ